MIVDFTKYYIVNRVKLKPVVIEGNNVVCFNMAGETVTVPLASLESCQDTSYQSVVAPQYSGVKEAQTLPPENITPVEPKTDTAVDTVDTTPTTDVPVVDTTPGVIIIEEKIPVVEIKVEPTPPPVKEDFVVIKETDKKDPWDDYI